MHLFVLLLALLFCSGYGLPLILIIIIAIVVCSLEWWCLPLFAGLGLIGYIFFKITPDNTKVDNVTIEDAGISPRIIPTTNMILRLYKGHNINLSRKFVFGMNKYPDTEEAFNALVRRNFLEEWRKDSGLKMVRLTPLGKIALNKAIRHRFKDVVDYTEEELNQILTKTRTI